MMKKKRSAIDRFMALTEKQKATELLQFDRPADSIATRKLTAKEALRWKKVQGKLRRGRPKIGKGLSA
jgi:hypothetical protein